MNASRADPAGLYMQIRSSEAPLADNSIDLIFSSFVLLEIPSKGEILKILREFRRLLKQNGKTVIIVNTEDFYRGRWVGCDVNFPENSRTLRSGQQVKVMLVPEKLVLLDYFWSDKDYKELFKTAGLRLINELKPLGTSDDKIEWLDELKVPPHVIYVLGN